MAGKKATTTIAPGDFALSVGYPEREHSRGWKFVPLSDIAELATGHTPSRKKPEYWEGDIPWMAVGDARKVDGKVITETKEYTNQLGIDNSAAVLLPKDTVCLSRTASIGYSILLGKPMATSQGFVNWICSSIIKPRFLQCLFLAERRFLYSISEGTAHTTIYFPEVKAFHVALPTLAEQERIVAKLDTLFAGLERTKQRMERIPQLLKNFRQAVLTQAVTGNGLFTTLGNLDIEIKTGPFGSALHKSDYIKGGTPVINPSHIINGKIVPNDDISITDLKLQELESWLLQDNDIVLGRRGEMGRAALYLEKQGKMLCGTGSLILRPKNGVSEEFLTLYLRSQFCINFLESNSVGSTMINLNQKIIKSLPFPDLTYNEQVDAIQNVSYFFSKADAIEKQYEALKQKIDVLPQAILAKAFKGELVEQNPLDEPASVLLEKIQELKGGSKKGKKSNSKMNLAAEPKEKYGK
nr:restriction endonuclease subunit S [uncultured Carboxylicivirga sp.]